MNFIKLAFCLLLTMVTLGAHPSPNQEKPVSPLNSYEDLTELFSEWRMFERPPFKDNVPDYSAETFELRHPKFKALQKRLIAIDTTGWDIKQKADWMIVWAEMNGYDFNYRVLKPWQRDPAFYKTLWMYRSDVPAHEGPTHHSIIELWQYNFPLQKAESDSLLDQFKKIPALHKQAKKNLVGNARELWIAGIRTLKNQSKNLETLKNRAGLKANKKILKAIDAAIESTDDLVGWLENESANKTGASGIGKKNYTWYLQNVHLVPMTWEDEVQLLKRELARAWSSLKLEEHRNRNLPLLKAADNKQEFTKMTDIAAKSLLGFLENQNIVTVKPYFKPALYAHLGRFIPEEKRNFFEIGRHYDARPLYSHFYHWFELARMDNEPNASFIRKGPLLYNIFDSRNEGTATAVEEMFMQAGLYDDTPRVREIVYIMIAQRAARGLGSLYAHANEMTMEAAGSIHSEYTPRGWMKTEKELLLFEQHLYLRQPGYGTSYITGKYLLEAAMADYAKMMEEKNRDFELKTFFDELNSIGNIPISLGHWQMTGSDSHLLPIISK